MKSAVSELEAHTGYWLRCVSSHVSHAFSLKLETRGVTVAEWVVMRELLRSGAASPSRIAKSLGLTRGAISKLADRLLKKRLVRRQTDSDDRRWQSITLSPAGLALVPELAAAADENDREFFGHLSHEERCALKSMLKEIVRRQGLKKTPID